MSMEQPKHLDSLGGNISGIPTDGLKKKKKEALLNPVEDAHTL